MSLDVAAGDFVAVAGPSGSGKSTLLALLAGIDRPTTGRVRVAGMAIEELTESGALAWRATAVGIVFQFFHLMPTLSALENVMLPMDFLGTLPPSRRRSRALALLDRLGVADQAGKRPATLSGGQQQRVAIARALANGPALIVADEPTGNLDSQNAGAVLDLFADLASNGQTVMTARHDPNAWAKALRTIQLRDGRTIDGGRDA